MRTIEIDGAAVAVREWDAVEAEAVPILFWHALGPAGSGATIGEAAPVLAARGYRTIAIDAPGFGGSGLLPPARYRIGPILELVTGVVEALELDRPVLMGHSWGGAVMLAAAARAPESIRALVLLDSGHIDYGDLDDVDPGLPWQGWLAAAAERTARWPDEAAFEAELREAIPRWSDELLGCYLPGLHREGDALAGAPAEARAAAMWALATERVSYDWPAVAAARLPTLLLLATREPWGSQNEEYAPRFERSLPHAEVRRIEGAGHALTADLGPELGTLVADWLDGEEASLQSRGAYLRRAP
jgi:pimeloyl-ACP methyl ester carboxylesterase